MIDADRRADWAARYPCHGAVAGEGISRPMQWLSSAPGRRLKPWAIEGFFEEPVKESEFGRANSFAILAGMMDVPPGWEGSS